ncbi:hypothetical protein M413DRAFT_13817 [Hebeloma cylindrosporum]|uniref:G-protein coupled receptors family 1 profile domain-containing protein n=1 Tax=Hebeloma cylindrosporum TaxID=76867 RepID=A0A0C2Y6K2_HEBCY|nr:hypothetical protein M413DRAFT_13817 [Hebeloma cylindrosporum h7]
MNVDDALGWIRLDHALAYMQLAVATCVIYDHTGTHMGKWSRFLLRRRKWSTVQCLYLVTRYFGDISQVCGATYTAKYRRRKSVMTGDYRSLPSDESDRPMHPALSNVRSSNSRLGIEAHPLVSIGHTLNIIQGTILPVTLWTMQAIMMYRISSMYNHVRKIIVLLLSAYAIEFVAVVVAIHLSIRFGTDIHAPPQANICKIRTLKLGFVAWISIALFELTVLVLAVKVALGYFHSARQMDIWHKNSLVYVLLRDSVLFPLIALLTCVINIVSSLKLSYFAGQLTKTFSTMLPIVLGCRLILNLRETYYQPFAGEVTLNLGDEPDYDGD